MKKKYLTILQIVDRITVSAGNRRYNTEQSGTDRISFTESVGFGFFGFSNGTPVIPDAETTSSVLFEVVLQKQKGYNQSVKKYFYEDKNT